MPIVAMKDMLQHAYDNSYAVSAFELLSLDVLEGIVAAAERCHSPVILTLSDAPSSHYDFELLMPAVEAAARRSSQPMAIHLCRSISINSVIRAINSGCNSVMLDNRLETLQNNILRTSEVVRISHACGVPVEGALDIALGVEAAQNYVQQTGVDFLAVSSNTIYGRRKDDPRLNHHYLSQVNKSLRIPFVIHGGAGLSKEQYQQFIAHGVAKINYGSSLYDTTYSQIRNNAESHHTDYSQLMEGVREVTSSEVEACLRLGKSMNRGKALLEYCTPWTPVEHLIIYNVHGISDHEVDTMMTEGQQTLRTIPGVREIIAGRAIKEDTQFRYTWLIRFCHPAVIDSYREHPLHVAFANQLFRPIAGDRISIDYLWHEQKKLNRPVFEIHSQGRL